MAAISTRAYGARYTALRGCRMTSPRPVRNVHDYRPVLQIWRYLIRDIEAAAPEAGDLLAVPMVGAYTLAMSGNYNQARRPPSCS